MKRIYSSKHSEDEIWDDNGCPICREMSEKRKAFYNRPMVEEDSDYVEGSISDNVESNDTGDYYGPFKTVKEMREWIDANN
jgi:hypothetical protein